MTDFDESLLPPGTTVNQPEPPSEPRKEPSVEELREWSAAWLGAKEVDAFFTGAKNYYSFGRGEYICNKSAWIPDQSIEHAWLLVEKMIANGVVVTLHSPEPKPGIAHWTVFVGNDGSDTTAGHEASAGLAILRAAHAYRAAQGKETP